ncbi:glycoside hydrolase family 95 protein [Dentipellis sp. KUC8613]|nr:glycoside hydrolase family 95 protein [Dentipellis sp. KUC8613]
MRLAEVVSTFVAAGAIAHAAPSGFPSTGNGLWYTQPGVDWTSEFLPIGNGYLAAMVPGRTAQEFTQLNIESLWAGGPFQDPAYNGSNPAPSQRAALAADMQQIQQAIFASPNGTIHDVEELEVGIGAYGSYAGAGWLVSTLGITGDVTNYTRWLDLDSAVAKTQWIQNGTSFLRTTFCSNPIEACVEHINTTAPSLPNITYAFSTALEAGLPTANVTCLDGATLNLRGLVGTPGMAYVLIGRVQSSSSGAQIVCTNITASNATVSVSGAQEAWITWVGGTNYDMDAGDAAHNFSFRGADPHDALVSSIERAAPVGNSSPSFASLLAQHIQDYTAALGNFSLSLGQQPDFDTPTDQLWDAYQTDTGDAYLEWLLFNYGRYMLVSSSRGALPANLQGKWAAPQSNSWGADANINLQMNYWMAEMTNLNVTKPLFDYMEKTWVPRGTETAQILYNISRGWVTHDEIFGHTGMKLNAPSSQASVNYPDHFDYTHDVAWWKSQGWPLLKGAAEFQLEKLIPDLHFNDSTLVVSPCNSPEQTPVTFGCAHAQQVIWQLLNAAEKGYEAASDTDEAFLDEVRTKRSQMDKGIHIGSWGQLQEWKFDMDSPSDTHRHLSHLVGMYPGYALTGFNASIQGPIPTNGTLQNYTAQDVIDAATISLIHRGNGTGPDADSGWEKVWRAAQWAQLGNATEFYHELSYAIERNFGRNLFSVYTPHGTPFQIDANLAYPAVVLNGLVQAPDVASYSAPLRITLLPALPSKWRSGKIQGARLRGGMTLDLQWADGKPTQASIVTDATDISRPVQIVYGGNVVKTFTAGVPTTQDISF